MVEYPECEKMKAAQPKSQVIGEFLEWLSERGIVLAKLHEHTDGCLDEDGRHNECGCSEEMFYPIHKPTEKVLAEYYNIDLAKVEIEKREMLRKMRT